MSSELPNMAKTRVTKVITYLNSNLGKTTNVDEITRNCFPVREYTLAKTVIYYTMIILECLGYVDLEYKKDDKKFHQKVKLYTIMKQISVRG